MNIVPDVRFFVGVDEMFYRAACNCLARAERAEKEILGALDQIRSLEWYASYVANDLGDEIDFSAVAELYDLTQDDLLKLSSVEDSLQLALEAYLEAVAQTHVCSAAALEAHINYAAREVLPEKKFKEFEPKPLAKKWLFLPQSLSKRGFATESEPYQSFRRLVSYRNSLMHHKAQESLTLLTIEDTNSKLGLNLNAARESVESIRGMIKSLADILDADISLDLKGFAVSPNYIQLIVSGEEGTK